MELQYRKNDKTGEELYYTTHSSGLGKIGRAHV